MIERALAYKESLTDLDVRIEAHQKYSSLKMESLLEELLERAKPKRICDLGCGSGNYSELFALRCLVYVGLDANASLLTQAARTCEERGVENALFMQWDMNHRFPFALQSFDFLFSGFSAYYVDDAEKLIRNCRDVLAENGEAWFVGPLLGNASELDLLSEAIFGVSSSPEKDIRVARLHNEFVPMMKEVFGYCDVSDRDFSLNFPSTFEYAKYYKATPQFLELAGKFGSPTDEVVEESIRSLTALKLTKKSTFLSAKKYP